MTKRLSNVAPLQLGIVLGVLYAAMSLIVVPFMLMFTIFASSSQQGSSAGAAGLSVFFIILIPVIYGVFGFIGGVISAFIYNIIAGWTGGIEFTLTDVA